MDYEEDGLSRIWCASGQVIISHSGVLILNVLGRPSGLMVLLEEELEMGS